MSSFALLSIIVTSYEDEENLRRCLACLEAAAPEAEVVVVDASGSHGPSRLVTEKFRWARLRRVTNHGWAHAINRGLEATSRPLCLLLNADAFVTRASLGAMLERLTSDHELAAVGPVLLNDDGTRQRCFSFVYWPNHLAVRKNTKVAYLCGACLLVRRSAVARLGGFDETFFLYNEEYDWCRRAREAGFRFEMVPARVVHVGGGTTRKSGVSRARFLLEEQRGFLYFAHKHWSPPARGLVRAAVWLEGLMLGALDPRAPFRATWQALRHTAKRGSWEESPFPISGRGANVRPVRAASDAVPHVSLPNTVERRADVRERSHENHEREDRNPLTHASV